MDCKNKTSRGAIIAAGAVLGAGVLCLAARHLKKSCGGGSCGCGSACKCGEGANCQCASKSEQKESSSCKCDPCKCVDCQCGKHEYTLTYFTMRARAEVSRLLFAAAKVEYKDVRFPMTPEFNHDAMKEERAKNPDKFPWGTLPTLQVDNGPLITQEHAIERYLAKELGFFGSNKTEAALIDGVTDAVTDLETAFIRICLTVEKDKQPAALQEHYKKNAGKFERLEKMLKQANSGFVVGNKPSLADFSIFHWIHTQCVPDFLKEALKDLPLLSKHRETVASLPGVEQWLAVRPETFF